MQAPGDKEEGKTLKRVDDRTVLVDYGPMHMYIQATDRGRPRLDLAVEGGKMAAGVLEDQARFIPLLKKKAGEIEVKEALPGVVASMVEAAQKMETADLTPMAAVAGAASDAVADYCIGKGGTKIIVDNGGDVALRLKGDETARVGIKTEIDAERPTYVLYYSGRGRHRRRSNKRPGRQKLHKRHSLGSNGPGRNSSPRRRSSKRHSQCNLRRRPGSRPLSAGNGLPGHGHSGGVGDRGGGRAGGREDRVRRCGRDWQRRRGYAIRASLSAPLSRSKAGGLDRYLKSIHRRIVRVWI